MFLLSVGFAGTLCSGDHSSRFPVSSSAATAALAVYRAALEPARAAGARTFEFALSPLDRLGLPLWTVALVGADGALSDGFGYGPTLVAAQASAWGETVEWYCAREWLAAARRTPASFAGLGKMGRAAVDPVSLNLSAGSGYDAERTVLSWVEARRHPSGEPVLVPVEFVAPRFADLRPGFEREHATLAVPITNGLGAGPTFAHALAHGILELLQRDGNSVHYRALDRGTVVDLGGREFADVADPETRRLLTFLDREVDIEVTVKLAADDFGMANLYVVGHDRELTRAPLPIALSACGEAVHPDREFALGKAVREFTMARARKCFNHGPLGPVRAAAPAGYVEAFASPAAMRSEDERALREMRGWMARSHAEFFEMLRRPVFERRKTVRFADLPTTPGPVSDAGVLLALLTERLAGEELEVLYVDFTPPGSPTTVLRAIVPGLEVETMTYRRIGARNVRRLSARGDTGIVGVGERGRPAGAVPVRLTARDAAAFGGGPVWFDPAAVDRAMGALYPLYREPGRHVLAVTAEGGV